MANTVHLVGSVGLDVAPSSHPKSALSQTRPCPLINSRRCITSPKGPAGLIVTGLDG
jgi:hypothetical protein